MSFTVKKLTPIDTSSLEKLGQGTLNLSKYVEDEFGQVAKAFQGTESDHIWNTAPPRPRRGTYAYADGTHWNPGFGEGPYWFDGTSWHPMGENALPGTFVKTVKVQRFTASGTYTPSAGMLYCIIECVGGGGGGGGAQGAVGYSLGGGGGGSGGYSRKIASAATIGASQVVTIGVGGPNSLGGSGTAGGATSVGSLCVANGGAGGLLTSTISAGGGGAGAAAGTGDFTATGMPGGYGSYFNITGTVAYGGLGGSSVFGGGGQYGVDGNGSNGTGYGGGGGGGSILNTATNASSGNGAPGVVIITEYCSQ